MSKSTWRDFLGGGAIALAGLSFAISAPAFGQDNTPNVLSAPGGRYVFGQISSMRADQYLLDTQTGRVWQVVVNDKGLGSLSPIPYRSTDGNLYLAPPLDSTVLQPGPR